MTREEFLKQVWLPYPAQPVTHNSAGRIINISQTTAKLDNESYVNIPKEWLAVLRVGDIISVKLEQNQTKELTLLAPQLNRPLVTSSDPDRQKKWNHFLSQIRHFFSGQSFLEVQTPTLVKCPGTEPFLDAFETRFKMGQHYEDLFLPTSPELHLKKLLARGYRQIFEIKTCFRNGEISQSHQPEFHMLEWYRAYSNLQTIKNDTMALLKNLSESPLQFSSVSISELFEKHVGQKLFPDTNLITLKSWATQLGLNVENYTDWDDVFHLIYLEKIEPQLNSAEYKSQPVFVEKYPPSQAAFARLGSDGWAERFELYWQGLEICNAFHEVNDPELQQKRMRADLEKKQMIGKASVELDGDFFQALESGMPPSGGIALGLERLFMAMHGITDISSLKLFPMKNHFEKSD